MRATLGKHKATRPGDRVLVAATGGLSSTSLLHILQQGCNTDTKRLLFEPSIIYVDEGSVFGLSKADREKRIAEVVDILQTFGFPVFVALIENCGNDNISPTRGDETVRIDPSTAEVFGKSFTSLKEGSAKQELLLHLRRRTLVRAAQELECSKVFTAEHGTDLAVDLLSGVAGGAGGSLAQRIGFKDQRDGDVTVMRPMRDVSGKEVALYSHLHHLSTVTKGKTWGTGENVLYSLHKLTEDFLVGLQQDFPPLFPPFSKLVTNFALSLTKLRAACCAKVLSTRTTTTTAPCRPPSSAASCQREGEMNNLQRMLQLHLKHLFSHQTPMKHNVTERRRQTSAVVKEMGLAAPQGPILDCQA